MTIDIALWRRHCQEHPGTMVEIQAWELLELLDRLEAGTKQRDAAREHLERRHGCTGACRGEE